jgi:hypothetical protein
MAKRPRHQRPELEAILRQGEALGWRAEKGNQYYRMWCPCGTHQKTVRLTPSDPNYARNLRGWLRRTGCWES